MGKLGKLCIPVMLVFAIAAVTLSISLKKAGEKSRDRAEILAQGLADAAKTLDSGSGEASKATFSPAIGGGREGGTLGWDACRTVDLRSSSNSYAGAAESVNNLARQVVKQRADLAEQFVEIGRILGTPAKMAPDAGALTDLTAYDKGADGLKLHARNMVQRDAALRELLNRVMGAAGVRERYNGDIPENGGGLSDADRAALEAGLRALNQLRTSNSKYAAAMGSIHTTLGRIRINGVSWAALPGADRNNVDKVIANARENLRRAGEQLLRINQLTQEIRQKEAQIREKDQQLAVLLADKKETDRIIDGFFKQGLGLNYAAEDAPVKQAYSEVAKDLSGTIRKVNAEYGFVIVSVTANEAVEGLKFSIHRNNQYLGMLRIVNPGRYNSLAVVEDGDVAELQVGDAIVVASEILQDKVSK